MAVRLYSEFKSDRGYQYKIEIHDSQWIAAATTFNVDGRGFELTYEGETDDVVSPIVGSKLTFGAYSTDATFETFIGTLKSFQENRFRIVVRRAAALDTIEAFANRVVTDGGTLESESCIESAINELGGVDEYKLYWAGWIVQDLVTIEDESQPYVYAITAADGLGRLANIDYTAFNDVPAGLTRVSDLIGNCLEFAEIYDLWGASEVYLETSVNWWETSSQTYSATKDTLQEHAIDIRVFESEDDDGNTLYSKAYDVIKELCITYGARIYQSNGRWVFEQYVNRSNTTRIVSTYDNTLTRLATASRFDDVTIDQSNGFARLTGGQFNFLPAVGSVSVEYARDKFNAESKPYTFRSTAPTKTLGIIGASTATQLKFYGSHNYNITSSTSATTNDEIIAVVWRLQIRIESATTPGLFYYYNRAFNGFAANSVYGNAAWSTTAGYYYYHGSFAKVAFGAVSINAAPVVITGNLPTSGTLRVTSEHYANYLPVDGTAYTLEPHQTDTWSTTLTIVRMDNANDDVSVTYRASNSNVNVDSKIELALGTTRIANGLFQTGDLSVYNGSSWVSGISFRRGSSGAGDQILNLLTKEMVSLHAVPIKRFAGEFFTATEFEKRLVFDGARYLNIGGSFTARNDQFNGEWFLIDYLPANIGTLDEIRQPRSAQESGASNVVNSDGVVEVGRVGGMAVVSDEQRIGPYEQTATGGRINGTANITGVATMEKTTIVGLETFVDTFAARVTADGGVIESRSCVSDAITTLADGELVSLIPTALSSTLTANEAVTMRKTLGVTGATSLSSTLGVSGATTLSSTLGVTGAATMNGTTTMNGNATMNANARVNGSWASNIVDLEASASGEYMVNETDYILFTTWAGGSGTFTIKLPPVDAAEGRMIRIKTDSTISNSNALSIVPDDGDTTARIDGETSSAMTRSYDGATYLAHNGDWWVIQKKDKG
jgi:hypothetical protein